MWDRKLSTLSICRMWTTSPQTHISSQGESQLYIFEDNEAVIKMIIKDRSPTVWHVIQNPELRLDWLFYRINLDPKIQIKFVDTKKPICWHANQRKLHTWWVELSSSFVEYHEFVDVLLQLFQQFSFWSDRESRAPCQREGEKVRNPHEDSLYYNFISKPIQRLIQAWLSMICQGVHHWSTRQWRVWQLWECTNQRGCKDTMKGMKSERAHGTPLQDRRPPPVLPLSPRTRSSANCTRGCVLYAAERRGISATRYSQIYSAWKRSWGRVYGRLEMDDEEILRRCLRGCRETADKVLK